MSKDYYTNINTHLNIHLIYFTTNINIILLIIIIIILFYFIIIQVHN